MADPVYACPCPAAIGPGIACGHGATLAWRGQERADSRRANSIGWAIRIFCAGISQIEPALARVACRVTLAQHIFARHAAVAWLAVFHIGLASVVAVETGKASVAKFAESHSWPWPTCGKVDGPDLASGVGTAISICPTTLVDSSDGQGGCTRSEATVGDTRKNGTPFRRAPPIDRASLTRGETIRNPATSRCTFVVSCARSLQRLCAAKDGITFRPGACDQTRR
jgi:hypothetical protein